MEAEGQANVSEIFGNIGLARKARLLTTWHQKFFFGLVAKRPISKKAILLLREIQEYMYL